MIKQADREEIGVAFQARTGVAEFSAGAVLVLASIAVLFGIFEQYDLPRKMFTTTFVVYNVLNYMMIKRRGLSFWKSMRMPRGEFILQVAFAAIVIGCLIYLNHWLKASGVEIGDFYLGLSFLVLVCIYLMLLGFISGVTRLVFYSNFCMILGILRLLNLVNFRQLVYVVIPFGMMMFIIGLSNLRLFIKATNQKAVSRGKILP